MRNGPAYTAPTPVPTDPPESAGSRVGSHGTLLGIVSLGAGSRLAIVGYLLPPADDSTPPAGSPPTGWWWTPPSTGHW